MASATPQTEASSIDPARTTPPVENAPIEKAPDEGSKLKTFLSVLRRFIGVSDLAAVRFSLPAQLLEPTPNLEYWGYLDRPEFFVAIPDSEDPMGRMLATLRFWFTKDLKYVKGKPCKPYNSTLGEFFRCNWEVEDTVPVVQHANSNPGSSAVSVSSKTSISKTDGSKPKTVRISYLTEQTSHHPPVSAFFIDCPEKGIIMRGYDQLSAKFTGTSIRVTAGAHNLGIFVDLTKWGNEQYQLTHPSAHVGGLLRGSLSVTVADSCYVTCPKTKIKVILQYLEEGWLGKTQNRVEGVIFTYDPDNDTKTTIKEVPEKDILGRIEGAWTDKVYYTLGNAPSKRATEKHLLLDLNPLTPLPKIVPPTSEQLPNESRKFWAGVTNAIVNKQYSLATTLKHDIEEKQRGKAKERQDKGEDWKPRFFTGAVTPPGRPELTNEGEDAIRGMHRADYKLKENEMYGA